MISTPMSNLTIAEEKSLRREILQLKDQLALEKTYADGMDTLIKYEREHRDCLITALTIARKALKQLGANAVLTKMSQCLNEG